MLQAEVVPTTPDIPFTKINVACAHGRMIDDVLTEERAKTGNGEMP